MFKFFRKRKRGQSTLEYAILIIIIIGALLAIQVYVKRGVQGRLRSAADDIGDQFSPGNTNITKATTVLSSTHDTFKSGVTNAMLRSDESTLTTMTQNIINMEQEFWGKTP